MRRTSLEVHPDVYLGRRPDYRHTVGIARSWHFNSVYGFVLTGIFFVIGLLTSTQWGRLVPTSFSVFVQAWNTFVVYANFHFPPEPNGFYGYNALQQLAHFATVFVMAPLAILTGMAMSPALVNRFPACARVFGGRQGARSIQFLVLMRFIGFIVIHVPLVVLTGFARNMNYIVLGTRQFPARRNHFGADWNRHRPVLMDRRALHLVVLSTGLQHAEKAITHPVELVTFDQLVPREYYTAKDMSPRFWPNGTLPVREDWKQLVGRTSRATGSRSVA